MYDYVMVVDEDDVISGVDFVDAWAAHERDSVRLAVAARRLELSGEWAHDGSVSMASWLRHHCRMSNRDATALVHRGRFLEKFTAVGDAARTGALSAGQTAALQVSCTAAVEPVMQLHQEELVTIVQGGTIDFDRCIATPDMMPLVGRLGKVLGPRGLMPNPKVGTVTMDVKAAVAASKGGAVEFRVEKAGIIQGSVGKASFGEAKLEENIKAFVDAVAKAKPTGSKGTYLQRIALSSTMGPGVKVEMASVISGQN